MISLRIKTTKQRLLINYSDNGKGMAPETSAEGIDIQDIQERVSLLNGEIQVHNTYPEGYSIDILTPLI